MADVYNWQLGRDMAYPHEEARPQRQFAMVMDPNKCIACQTCTIACKQTWTWGKGQEYVFWNNVETKPFGSYPTGWDLRSLALLADQAWEEERYAGVTVFEAAARGESVAGWLPSSEHWAQPNLGEDEPVGQTTAGTYLSEMPHEVWNFYLQRICNHCTYPACLAACPRDAIYKREEDGIVLVDQERCRGYQECIRACPYKKVIFNTSTRVSEKCIGCYPYLEEGVQNRCVVTCIGRIRLSGYLHTPDDSDPANPMDFIVHERQAAVPLYPQFGTEPNVYYFPPIQAPTAFLKQIFGPGASRAVEAYRRVIAGDDPDLQGLLMLFGATDRIIHRFEVDDGTARGYDADGALVAEVPVREPAYVRLLRDDERGTFRTNIT
jgi:nitrate reductase / nitrite oxidoreductase, beta subunit